MSGRKTGLLWLMGLFYVVAGLNHFVHPGFYLPMIPPSLPWHLGIVRASGAAEVILGALVLVPAARAIAAWGLVLLLIAIFPANVHIALYNVPLGGAREGAGMLNWIRLPLQAVLIAWAWWYTGKERDPGRSTQRGVVRATGSYGS